MSFLHQPPFIASIEITVISKLALAGFGAFGRIYSDSDFPFQML